MIVWVLLVVFAGFAVVTLAQMDPSLLAFSTYPSWSKIIASVALTFFAYLGFSVVTFTAGDLDDPARSLPRAMYLSLGITALVYVAVSLGVFGTLTVDEVIANGDTALAEAARPVLGDAGFTIMAITALLATSSSVNSNIFAAGNLTFALSELAQFPPVFGQPGYFRGRRGVTITVVLVLDSRQRVRPERDRLARERGVAGRLPRGRCGRAAAALGVGLEGLGDRRHDARDVDRARPVRDRHRAQRAGDVRGDAGPGRPRGRPRCGVEAPAPRARCREMEGSEPGRCDRRSASEAPQPLDLGQRAAGARRRRRDDLGAHAQVGPRQHPAGARHDDPGAGEYEAGPRDDEEAARDRAAGRQGPPVLPAQAHRSRPGDREGGLRRVRQAVGCGAR